MKEKLFNHIQTSLLVVTAKEMAAKKAAILEAQIERSKERMADISKAPILEISEKRIILDIIASKIEKMELSIQFCKSFADYLSGERVNMSMLEINFFTNNKVISIELD